MRPFDPAREAPVAAATRRALVLLLMAGALGCGPWGPLGVIPGGPLVGSESGEPLRDWSFSDAYPLIAVESRGGGLPYSRGAWFMAYGGRVHLLLPSFFGDGLKRRIDADPRLRLRVGDVIYAQRAVHVDDPEIRAAMVNPFLLRQMAIEIDGAVRAAERPPGDVPVELWVYRLDDPEETR